VIGRNARGDFERGHGREPRERDERGAAVVRGADKSHEIYIAKKRRIVSALTGENYKTKSAGAEQLVHSAQRMHATLRPHEDRTVFPERAGNSAGDVDPRGAIAVRDRSGARGAHDGSRAAARFPNGEPAERKSAAGECAVELGYSCGDRIGVMPRDLNGVGKTLFEQGSEGGDLG